MATLRMLEMRIPKVEPEQMPGQAPHWGLQAEVLSQQTSHSHCCGQGTQRPNVSGFRGYVPSFQIQI